MTRDSQGFFVADGLSFTKPVVILRPVRATCGHFHLLGTCRACLDLLRTCRACLTGDPEWDDVEEWFNTYKELLEREEEEHG